MKRFLFLLLLSLPQFGFQSQSDEGLKLLESSLKKYFQTSELAFKFKMKLACDKQGKGVNQEIVEGFYERKGDDFIFKQGAITSIFINGYMINISEKDKVLMIQKGQMKPNFDAHFSSILGQEEGESKLNRQGNKSIITIIPTKTSMNSYISSTVIELNSNLWINKVTTYFDRKAQQGERVICDYLQIEYHDYQLKNINQGNLNLNKYVHISDENEVELASQFKNYQLVSTLNYEMK